MKNRQQKARFMKKVFIYFTIGFAVLTAASFCKKNSAGSGGTNPPPGGTAKVYYEWTKFVMGADLSYVNEVQDFGGVYKDSGATKDPYKLFKDHGANLVRVRLWHNPQWQSTLNGGKIYNDLADVEKTIKRAKMAGMAVNLDLHYSDSWADPGKQETPAAWNGLSLTLLKDSVYQYTLRVLNYLKSKDLTPEMIQIGNETNPGMLFPAGKVVNDDWTAFAELLKSGIKAVRDFSATSTIKPQIILHVAQLQNADWWANGVINKGGVTDFDVLGLSHYYVWSTVPSMSDVASTISSLKNKYHKKVMIVEVSYPWTSGNADSYANVISGTSGFGSYAVSKEGQFQYMKDLTQQVISGGGSGIMYWEPAWITSSLKDSWGTGSSWDNNTFFDFSGNALPGIDYMTYPFQF
jgi:arabinogalactan endo-1,4-beta-galactosidase